MPRKGAGKHQSRHARDPARTKCAKAQIRTNTVTLGSLMQRAGACRDQSGHDFTLQGPQIRSKFCRGRARKQAWDPARAEHRCRAKALVRTKADTLGIPLGPNPCQGADKDQHRHGREFNATRRRLQGPKRPGSLARSGSRSGLAKASEATLGIPLGIPLGANAMPRKGVTLAEAIQLAHARPSCTTLGRVRKDSSHHACQRASPTIFAVSCNGSNCLDN